MSNPKDFTATISGLTGSIDPGTSLDEDGYLKEEIVLRLTALEAGALEGMVDMVRAQDRFYVNVKGRTEPVKMSVRIQEKLRAAHLAYRQAHGL